MHAPNECPSRDHSEWFKKHSRTENYSSAVQVSFHQRSQSKGFCNTHAKIRPSHRTAISTVATKQISDTLAQAQLVSRREQKVDVLVIGAGPTGLACGIEAQ